MFKTYIFLSVFEGNNTDLRNVAPDLINGLKVYHNGDGYVIGNLALTEGVSPHRNINAAPDELDYNLLMKSGLLVANQKLGNPLTITSGFPFSTFQLYKETASNLLNTQHVVEYDGGTYGGGGKKSVQIESDQVQIIPEVIGCAIALRKGIQNASGNFFVISLGYGTLEGLVSTEGGIIQRTSLSTFGLRYAVNLLEKELAKQYYLELKTEHQIDAAFQKGVIFLNRKRIDIQGIRDKVLKQYYDDVISPAMRKAFNDNDFTIAHQMFLAGGGAMYPALVDCFKQEFQDVLDLEVAHEPQSLASRGYCINSAQLNGGAKANAVGLDIGNSSTIVSVFDENNLQTESSIPSEY